MDEVPSLAPLLNYLSDGEIEWTEKERDKDIYKRRKCNMRGRRGITLPDREPIKTYRTPAIGFPELGPATLALAVAASAPTLRRAAASVSIANMVAFKNGVPLPQSMPIMVSQPPPMLAVKDREREKCAKGLFKAPSYPPSVLHVRARVAAPTPSMATDVSLILPPLDSDPPAAASTSTSVQAARVLVTRRVKELEREAKEKEYADGQHAHMINGVWHCSNCGCPDSIAIGQRKGPLCTARPGIGFGLGRDSNVGVICILSAETPSTTYGSLPCILSESDCSTTEVCLTEYVAAEKCRTKSSADYTAAELCLTLPETEYWTAEPKDIPSLPISPRLLVKPEPELERSRNSQSQRERERTRARPEPEPEPEQQE